MYILFDFFTILKHVCFACEAYWLIHKHAARLYQPCRNHCLFTTLKSACGCDKSRVVTTFWQGCHNLVTTLYQPCDNLVPTLPLPCSQVVTRLIQAGHNVVNRWLYYLVTRLSQPSFFYMGMHAHHVSHAEHVESCVDRMKWWSVFKMTWRILRIWVGILIHPQMLSRAVWCDAFPWQRKAGLCIF